MAMAKPTYFMPVHGEAVHLRAHAQLARKMGIKDDHIFILDNGDTLEMRGGIVKRGTPVESGVVYVDGLRIGDTDPIVLRDRQKLANDGMVTAVAIVSLKHKKIEAIEFSGRGVSFAIDDQFSEDASASIMKTIEKGKFSFTSSGSDAIRKAVRDSLSNFIWSRTRTRPMIIRSSWRFSLARGSAHNAKGSKANNQPASAKGAGSHLRANKGHEAEFDDVEPLVEPSANRDIAGVVIAVLAIASFIAVISPATAPVTAVVAGFYHLGFGWALRAADRHFAVCRHALFG